jgi:hypothetical protein
MPPATVFLLALKGTCALNCLAALHLAGPRPVSQRTIMSLTGFDDAAVSKGLNTLRVLGLATCSGDRHRTAWVLAPAAHGLPLPLGPFWSSPENVDSKQDKEEEKKEKEKESNAQLGSSLLPAAANPENPDTGRGAPARPRSLRPADKRLRRQFYAAFEAADIYLQFRRPLAESLMAGDDGPAWLRQTLGWLCYAQRRLPHVKRGAVVYISLRDQLPCDPAYLPPPALEFDAALAWALRGGEAAWPEERADPAGDDLAAASPGPTAQGWPSPTPEAELWQALLARLSRELSPAVMDSQLRPARLLALGAERCLIAAATPQSRDWLRTRLAAVLARALAELAGRPLSVEIVVDG